MNIKILGIGSAVVLGMIYVFRKNKTTSPIVQESLDMNIYSYGVEGERFALSCTITNNTDHPITRQIAVIWGYGTYPDGQAAEPRWWMTDEPEPAVQWMTVALPWIWEETELNYREAYSLTTTWDGHVNEPLAVVGQPVWFAVIDDIGGVSNVVAITP